MIPNHPEACVRLIGHDRALYAQRVGEPTAAPIGEVGAAHSRPKRGVKIEPQEDMPEDERKEGWRRPSDERGQPQQDSDSSAAAAGPKPGESWDDYWARMGVGDGSIGPSLSTAPQPSTGPTVGRGPRPGESWDEYWARRLEESPGSDSELARLSIAPVAPRQKETALLTRQGTISASHPAYESALGSVRELTLAGAGGTRIPVGAQCDICFTDTDIVIASALEVDRIAYAKVDAVQVSGSTVQKDAGVWGGGFGIVGAAEGMLAASVINRLTRRTKRYAILRIASFDAEYVFASQRFDGRALAMPLTPVQLRIKQEKAKAASLNAPAAHTSQISLADELAKLNQLRKEGVLTDGEFDTAKAILLRHS